MLSDITLVQADILTGFGARDYLTATGKALVL